jgi:hypothetical protein
VRPNQSLANLALDPGRGGSFRFAASASNASVFGCSTGRRMNVSSDRFEIEIRLPSLRSKICVTGSNRMDKKQRHFAVDIIVLRRVRELGGAGSDAVNAEQQGLDTA